MLQFFNLRIIITRLEQQVSCMLSKLRCCDGRRRIARPKWRSYYLKRSTILRGDIDNHLTLSGEWRRKSTMHISNRCGRNNTREDLQPLVGGTNGERVIQEAGQGFAVLSAVLECAEARVDGKARYAQPVT